MKQEITAQLADWGAMRLNTALQNVGIFLKGNDTIFFVKGKKIKGRVSAIGRLWKVSILPKQPPGIEHINTDMVAEMMQVRRDNNSNNRNRKKAQQSCSSM
jgi:hypothetical protein